MQGGLIGLGIGVWFCFVFAVAYLVSPNGVSVAFRKLFCIFMLYVPCQGSYSLVVSGFVGIVVWGLVGLLIGFLVLVLSGNGSREKSGLEVRSFEEKFGKKVSRRKNKKSRKGTGDFKKYGKVLDARLERDKKKAEKEDAEIKEDLMKLGKKK